MLLMKNSDKKSVETHNTLYSRRMYGTVYGRGINLSARVRDHILPHRFVNVDIDKENGCIHFYPTDDENTGYKLTISGSSMAHINYCIARKVLVLPEKVKMPITLNDDGSLTMHISCAEGD